MGRHRATSNNKLPGSVLVGAVASGLAITALSSAGTANATCASISGIGNSTTPGNTCTSTATSFAVGLGSGVTATSSGFFSGAVANGATNTGTQTTEADVTNGFFSSAIANGPNTLAQTNGPVSTSLVAGNDASALAGSGAGPQAANVAINIGSGTMGAGPFNNEVQAAGMGNVATNMSTTMGPNFVLAFGTLNTATNIGGTNNVVQTGVLSGGPGTLSNAFNVGGSNNAVATGGSFATAGAVGLSNQNGANAIFRNTPGFNINHVAFP